ncbi:MAG TPA: hypothetical protein VI756_21535 [Blastocatellia bacterium]
MLGLIWRPKLDNRRPLDLALIAVHTNPEMRISGVIWLRNIVDKLAWKHQLNPEEVEEIFNDAPRYRFLEKGTVEGENLYSALGRTEAGRYLIIYFFIRLLVKHSWLAPET